jgi:hypothetical protein
MGASMRRSSWRAHRMWPATRGALRGSGGFSLCRSYSACTPARSRAYAASTRAYLASRSACAAARAYTPHAERAPAFTPHAERAPAYTPHAERAPAYTPHADMQACMRMCVHA